MEMIIQRFQKCGIFRLPTAVHCPVLQAAVSDEGGCHWVCWLPTPIVPLQHCSTAAISSVSILSWSVTDGWLQFTATVTASLHTSADYYQDYKQIVITAEEARPGTREAPPRHDPVISLITIPGSLPWVLQIYLVRRIYLLQAHPSHHISLVVVNAVNNWSDTVNFISFLNFDKVRCCGLDWTAQDSAPGAGGGRHKTTWSLILVPVHADTWVPETRD